MLPPSGNDDWCTPPDWWARGLHFFGVFSFDFDPCWNPGATLPASRCWDKKADGLAQRWEGVAWCNPPYSRIGPWARRGYETWRRGETETLWIIPNATGTTYWHRYYWRAPMICFVGPGRVSFVDAEGQERRGNNKESAIVAFVRGDKADRKRFRVAFGDVGKVVEP